MPRKKQSDDVYLVAYTDAGVKSQAEMLRLGMPLPPPMTPAQRELELPADLSEVASAELGRQQTLWTALANYASIQAMLLYNDLKDMQSRLKSVEDAAVSRVTGSRVSEKKARARLDPASIKMHEEAAHTERVYNLVDTQKENYLRCWQAVSREIARRQGEHHDA